MFSQYYKLRHSVKSQEKLVVRHCRNIFLNLVMSFTDSNMYVLRWNRLYQLKSATRYSAEINQIKCEICWIPFLKPFLHFRHVFDCWNRVYISQDAAPNRHWIGKIISFNDRIDQSINNLSMKSHGGIRARISMDLWFGTEAQHVRDTSEHMVAQPHILLLRRSYSFIVCILS